MKAIIWVGQVLIEDRMQSGTSTTNLRYTLWHSPLSPRTWEKARNFFSPRAYMEDAVRTVWHFVRRLCSRKRSNRNFSTSQNLYRGEELGIFPSPEAYIKGELWIFLVPEPIPSSRARYLSRFQSLRTTSPSAYMEDAVRTVTPRISLRSVLRQQAVLKEKERSKFILVPEPI